MAITIEQSPQSFTMANNDLLWVFSSSQFGQPNFEFKVEVVVDGVTISTDKIFPLSGGNAYYNATEIVAPFFDDPEINTDITTPSALCVDMGVLKEVELIITEVYGTTPAEEGTATTDTVDVWRASLSDLYFIDYDATDYIKSSGARARFLSDFPRVDSPSFLTTNDKYFIDIDSSQYLAFYLDDTRSITLNIYTYDVNNNFIDLDSRSLGEKTKGVYLLNVSPKESSVDLTGAYTYMANITIGGVSVPYENFYYYLSQPCEKDRTVYFYNKLGGIDSWIFNKEKTVDRDFKRQTYGRDLGVLNGSSYDYSKFRSRMVNHYNTSQSKITLSSDWTDANVISWLVRELLESPLIWMEDENYNKIAMHITNASMSEPQDRYTTLEQLTIELDSGFKSASICR
jgi:hypothetical protein